MDTARPTFAPGSEFAGYRIESIAGRGGMGIVYRATQLALGRPVALKLLTAQLAADDAFRERFRREWETAAAIDHPNVIPLYEAGEHEGTLFIAMRFVEGVDLSYLSGGEPMDAGKAVRFIAQIAAALDAAHARGLVHRDVKPANVLIGAGDHAYLSDFGLSREASSTRLTRTGLFVGSTDYAAPEQVRGEATDARTDVYALGCVLYQLVTGSVPFARSGDMAKMYAHITEPPPLVSDTRPDLPELDGVVERAMAKDPADRFQSAGDLARAAMRAPGDDAARWHGAPGNGVAASVGGEAAWSHGAAGNGVAGDAPRRGTSGSPSRGGWDTAPVGLAALPSTSAATPSGSVPGWATGPAGSVSSAAVAAAPAGLGGLAGASAPLAEVPGSRAHGFSATSLPVLGDDAAPSEPAAKGDVAPHAAVLGATAAPTGFATPAHAAAPISAPSRPAAPDSLVERDEPRASAWPQRRRLALIVALPSVLVAGIAAAGLAAAGVFEGDAPRAVATPAPPTATATVVATPSPTVAPAAAVETIEVGKGPDGVAVSQGQVLVANHGDGTLTTIDPESNATSEPVEVGTRPDHVVAGKGVVWVGVAGSDAVARFENGRRTASVTVGDRPEAIALGKQLLWVANRNDGTVNRVDRAAPALVGSPIGVGTEPAGIFVGRRFVWVTNFKDGTVNRIDPATAQLVGDAIPTGAGPRGVIETPNATWIANANENTVTRLDRRTGKPINTIRVGKDPRELAHGFGAVWVTNSDDNTVTRLDEATGKVIGGPIPVGENPLGIAAGADAVWVANHESHTVTRIRP